MDLVLTLPRTIRTGGAESTQSAPSLSTTVSDAHTKPHMSSAPLRAVPNLWIASVSGDLTLTVSTMRTSTQTQDAAHMLWREFQRTVAMLAHTLTVMCSAR